MTNAETKNSHKKTYKGKPGNRPGQAIKKAGNHNELSSSPFVYHMRVIREPEMFHIPVIFCHSQNQSLPAIHCFLLTAFLLFTLLHLPPLSMSITPPYYTELPFFKTPLLVLSLLCKFFLWDPYSKADKLSHVLSFHRPFPSPSHSPTPLLPGPHYLSLSMLMCPPCSTFVLWSPRSVIGSLSLSKSFSHSILFFCLLNLKLMAHLSRIQLRLIFST